MLKTRLLTAKTVETWRAASLFFFLQQYFEIGIKFVFLFKIFYDF